MASARELEMQIFSLEEIKIIIRTSPTDEFPSYPYERKAAGSTSVADWIEARLRPILGYTPFEIIGGNYSHPHGRTKMETLRNSYAG